MKVLATRAELDAELEPLWRCAARISLVPTMGALHEGHLSLVRLCGPCDVRVVSIFVNPTQFGPNEDFGRYPRTLEQDVELLEHEGVDYVYAPSVEDMYGGREAISIDPGPLGSVWEGAVRPGHFAGVLTVVMKFFQQVKPDAAIFGEKDFQQLTLVRAMCGALDLPVQIVAGKTLREADGLAMSSRNRYLKSGEREVATQLYRALRSGREAFERGERELAALQGAMRSKIEAGLTIDYLTAVDSVTLREETRATARTRLIGAIRVGSVRLIDNLAVTEVAEEPERA